MENLILVLLSLGLMSALFAFAIAFEHLVNKLNNKRRFKTCATYREYN